MAFAIAASLQLLSAFGRKKSEVFLARKAQMAYATIGMVTDDDSWLQVESLHANALGMLEVDGKTTGRKFRQILTDDVYDHAVRIELLKMRILILLQPNQELDEHIRS